MRIFMVLPLVLLALGFLLGVARLYSALVFFACWMVLVSALVVVSMIYGLAHFDLVTAMVGMVMAGLLALPSMWFAVLFSFATSKRISPAPVKVVYEAYQALDDSQKEKVHRLAKIGLAFAARHGSTYLRNKGHNVSADMLGDASKLI
ncbi:MAG TPA: hypothetical protein VMR46_02890 [Candidatus Paceibacterota bacterium]|nr:hypothetical protein [Candidatus Paceibacterota bacterium]